MPYSSEEGKAWLIGRVTAVAPKTIVDVGAGWGTYARLLRHRVRGCRFIAIEVYEPYVERFGLESLYDEVIVGDVRQVELPRCDVAILGDVLEHLPQPDAVAVWDKVRRAAGTTLLSLPIVRYRQGASEGNVHEAHLHTWDHDQVLALGGIVAYQVGRQIGVYEACRLEPV
ncbi:MAG TPA: class I SAM-dependent methyltransferase [Actinomadura sp.]|jgi:2-polyprenyl-3-methyl-5-hydroxy-6-metoxy-1,4-benzoquinol methylase|nr:class I SAM-dependent methyltransferase [Actinomadura sp.]